MLCDAQVPLNCLDVVPSFEAVYSEGVPEIMEPNRIRPQLPNHLFERRIESMAAAFPVSLCLGYAFQIMDVFYLGMAVSERAVV